MLKFKLDDLDAVLYTHHHVDHILGMDDLRQINQRLHKFIDIFGNENTMDEISVSFRYAFNKDLIRYMAVPMVKVHKIGNEKFNYHGVEIIPIEVWHGKIKIFGYRVGKFAYITDCSKIPEEEFQKLENLDVLIVNSLRRAPHPTHFSVSEAVETAQRVKAKKTYFTHITHDLNHEKINSSLPHDIELAYDGLEFDLPD
jgi:phosphoribosyl 1,2-cyclic phosphate phosphodiesterase